MPDYKIRLRLGRSFSSLKVYVSRLSAKCAQKAWQQLAAGLQWREQFLANTRRAFETARVGDAENLAAKVRWASEHPDMARR